MDFASYNDNNNNSSSSSSSSSTAALDGHVPAFDTGPVPEIPKTTPAKYRLRTT